MEPANKQRGVQLYELGRYKEAINHLSKEKDFESLFYLANSYLNEHDITQAEQISIKLLQEDPENPDVFFLRARIALEKNNIKDATKNINEAISIFPYRADYFGFKGAIFFNQKEFSAALVAVNEGLSIEPNNTFCLNLRAQLLTKLKQKEAASQTVEHLLQQNPEDSDSHASVGWVALENGETQKALHHFKEALQFDPNNWNARDGMSTALKSKNLLYKWYLKYEFWMANKNTKNQWVFIIGIYIAYRLGVKFLTASGLEFLVLPLIIVYLIFALGSWFMEPLSNAILNFDNYGKYLLSELEKNSGTAFSLLLIAGLLSGISYYVVNIDYLLLLAVTFLCALLPLPRAFLQPTAKSRNFGLVYGGAMLLVGVAGGFLVPNLYTVGTFVFLMFIAFTWISNLVK